MVAINKRQRQSGTLCISNYLGEFFYREPRYPVGRQHEVEGAILEAFCWLGAKVGGGNPATQHHAQRAAGTQGRGLG